MKYASFYSLGKVPHNLDAVAVHLLALEATFRNAIATFEAEGRPKCLEMKSPANISFSRSTLVFTPIPFSIYTTSSVATFPEAPLAYGQPPRPETEESTVPIPIW